MNKKEKMHIRRIDKGWFSRHMWNYRQDKEIHHEWENGCYCFLLTKEEHLVKTRREIRKKRLSLKLLIAI